MHNIKKTKDFSLVSINHKFQMNSQRIDKNVPFYLGFYKHRDMAIASKNTESLSKKIPKTLNSLDFGSMISKHKALRPSSNSRQSRANENKDLGNSQQRSDMFESYERTTFKQSTDIVRRNSLSMNKYNPRMSIQTSNAHCNNEPKSRKSAYVINRYNRDEQYELQDNPQSNSRWFDYSTQDPAYKSELLNYKVNINFKDGVTQLGKTQNIFKNLNKDFEEKVDDSRSSFNFRQNKKQNIFSATTAVDSELISFSKLIKISAKKKPVGNYAPTMQDLMFEKHKETDNSTSANCGVRLTNPPKNSMSAKKPISRETQLQISGIKLTMQLRRMAINVNKIWMRKAFAVVKKYSRAVILLRSIQVEVTSSDKRHLRTCFQTIWQNGVQRELFLKALLKLSKLVLGAQRKCFRLLKAFTSLAKLKSIVATRRHRQAAEFIHLLRISQLSHHIKDMQCSLNKSAISSVHRHTQKTQPAIQRLKIFSSFLIQLRLILDDPNRELKKFMRCLKQKEALANFMQIHFDKRTKILRSQALLALRKLKIFAKYRRQLHKAFLSRKLAR
jgi:hypothetical protein